MKKFTVHLWCPDMLDLPTVLIFQVRAKDYAGAIHAARQKAMERAEQAQPINTLKRMAIDPEYFGEFIVYAGHPKVVRL